MNYSFSEYRSNGLRLCVDWIEFTAFGVELDDIFQFVGYSHADFNRLPTGLHGYRSRLVHKEHSGFMILSDGADDMGIHVEISGSAVKDVLEHYVNGKMQDTPFGKAYSTDDFDSSVLLSFFADVKYIGRFTRMDLAIDDLGVQYFTVPEVYDLVCKGGVISKFRKIKHLEERSLDSELQITGDTVYFGSRESEVMIRVYDKEKEQKADIPWVRWEIELKDSRANACVDNFLSGVSLQEEALGILSNYLRFIKLDNVRKSRCTTSEKWSAFIDGVKKIKLYLPVPPSSIEQTTNWLLHGVSKSLMKVYEQDSTIIEHMKDVGGRRWQFEKQNREAVAV